MNLKKECRQKKNEFQKKIKGERKGKQRPALKIRMKKIPKEQKKRVSNDEREREE